LDVLAERENIYRQLTQTADGASSNLKDSYKNYTIDPSTRYRNITTKIDHERILPLYDSDAQVFRLVDMKKIEQKFRRK
jgi:hypothetical protein